MVNIGSNFVKILASRTSTCSRHQFRCSDPVIGFRAIKTAPNNCTEAVFALKQQPAVLCSALCLQRQAIIVPQKTQMEELFTDLMRKLEDQNSKLSDHELRHMKDLEKIESMRRGEDTKQDDDDGYVTAMDAVDAWEAELNKFSFPQLANDLPVSSAIRRMDRKLFFVGKQSLGTQSHWCFPQVELQSGESLRDAAERLLQETVGIMKFNFVGNAPIGIYKYFFSRGGEHIPVKVFFHRVEILEDFLSLSKLVPPASEHMWLTSEELNEHLPKKYAKVVKRFLLDL